MPRIKYGRPKYLAPLCLIQKTSDWTKNEPLEYCRRPVANMGREGGFRTYYCEKHGKLPSWRTTDAISRDEAMKLKARLK